MHIMLRVSLYVCLSKRRFCLARSQCLTYEYVVVVSSSVNMRLRKKFKRKTWVLCWSFWSIRDPNVYGLLFLIIVAQHAYRIRDDTLIDNFCPHRVSDPACIVLRDTCVVSDTHYACFAKLVGVGLTPLKYKRYNRQYLSWRIYRINVTASFCPKKNWTIFKTYLNFLAENEHGTYR